MAREVAEVTSETVALGGYVVGRLSKENGWDMPSDHVSLITARKRDMGQHEIAAIVLTPQQCVALGRRLVKLGTR